eukprot:TRINITY_DN23402_c0_g1_i1.p1 TRINITY_DN23402_c0_g1~~TRINITY_DN23402_c0_g1_i1.p1  ORF type:complete len:420 (+),score=73.84 TRINITY_DN23402_c0_g1_i1:294-1553(+)
MQPGSNGAHPQEGVMPLANSILRITVSDPAKQGDGVQAYVTYKVFYKTTLPQYTYDEAFVIRRFSDFAFLHERLSERNKGFIIPPLPEKNVVEKFRFSADFIEARRRALEKLMNRLAEHPQLRFSADLQSFLEANEATWSQQITRVSDSSFFSTAPRPRDFMQMFKDVQSNLSHVVLGGGSKPEEDLDVDYRERKQFLFTAEEHLGEVQKLSLRLVKRQKEVGLSLAQFGEACEALGPCEGGTVGKALSELGHRAEAMATKWQKQSTELLLTFEEPLKEYLRMMTMSVRAVMADRAQAMKQYHEMKLDVESKQAKLARLKLQSPVRGDKIQEAEHEIQEAQRQCESSKEAYRHIVEVMGREMVRFEVEKTHDLRTVMQAFARGEADMARETAGMWRTLLPTLSAAKQQLQQQTGQAVHQ